MYQFTVTSVSTTHFTGALATNAAETEDIALPGALAGVNGNARGEIRSITIISQQNLAWELEFWRSATHGATIDADKFIGRWTFAAVDGVQEAGAGNFRYYIDGLDIPYDDADGTGKLHISLVNRDAVAKLAQGAGGDVVVRTRIEPPVFGWAGS